MHELKFIKCLVFQLFMKLFLKMTAHCGFFSKLCGPESYSAQTDTREVNSLVERDLKWPNKGIPGERRGKTEPVSESVCEQQQ